MRSASVELSLLRPARARGADRRGGVRGRRVHAVLGGALALGARARPRAAAERLDGVRVVELGCGLGVPSLVAAARGAEVTAIDWAGGRDRAARARTPPRNGLELDGASTPTGARSPARFDLALARRRALRGAERRAAARAAAALAPEVLLAEPGRPAADGVPRGAPAQWVMDEVASASTGSCSRLDVSRSRLSPGRRTIDADARRRPDRDRRRRSTTTARSTSTPSSGSRGTSSTTAPTGSSSRARPARARRSTDHERLDLVRAAIEAVGDRATVVAGTGTYSTAHSVDLTEQAHELGADAFLVVTPYYNKPPQRGIVAHFEAVAAATDRPIVVYNIPSRVVVNIEPETISRLAEIENVARRQAGARRPRRRRGTSSSTGLDLYAGDDDLLQPFLELGGVGGICVHTHIVGPQVAEQVRAAREGDVERAREIDAELAPRLRPAAGARRTRSRSRRR